MNWIKRIFHKHDFDMKFNKGEFAVILTCKDCPKTILMYEKSNGKVVISAQ